MSRVISVKPPSGSSHECTSCKSENLRVWWSRQWIKGVGRERTELLFSLSLVSFPHFPQKKNPFTLVHLSHLLPFLFPIPYPYTLALSPRLLVVTMMRLTVTTAARRTLVQPSQRVAPVVVSTRFYSEAFKKKEKAAEEVYFRQREEQEIKKLKEKLAKAEKEAEELRKKK